MNKDKHPTWNRFSSEQRGSSHFVDRPSVSQSGKPFVRYDHWDVIPMTVCVHRMSFTYWERTKGKQYRCQLNIRSMLLPYIWRSKQSVAESCIKISVMTKQTNKALWTKGSCLTVRCLIKSKATCLLANFSILYGSVTITTEIMQKRHGQTPRELILPIFYLPPVNSLIWEECFLWTTINIA